MEKNIKKEGLEYNNHLLMIVIFQIQILDIVKMGKQYWLYIQNNSLDFFFISILIIKKY